MSNVISHSTNESLVRVMRFFGISDYNRPLFSQAATTCGVGTFSAFIQALDQAIQADSRFGVSRRLRESVAREKTGRATPTFQRNTKQVRP